MKNNVQGPYLNEKLIRECRDGNRQAQFELYRLYYKAMFNTAFRIVNDYTEAEDIMQESFLKAFQKIGSYKAEYSFGSWLKRIVVNHSIDYVRKRKLEFVSMTDALDVPIIEEIDTTWEIHESTKYSEVINEIKNLPEGYRIVLSLFLLEGYDHDEISKILKISSSTSRSQFMRAKKRLVEIINERHDKNEKTRPIY